MPEPVEQRVTRLRAPDEQPAPAGIPDGVYEAAVRAIASVLDERIGSRLADVARETTLYGDFAKAATDVVWLLAVEHGAQVERAELLASMAATFRDIYPDRPSLSREEVLGVVALYADGLTTSPELRSRLGCAERRMAPDPGEPDDMPALRAMADEVRQRQGQAAGEAL